MAVGLFISRKLSFEVSPDPFYVCVCCIRRVNQVIFVWLLSYIEVEKKIRC